jgi:hypothetical protein
MSKVLRVTDTFRWRLAIGTVLIVGGYVAWLVIPLVVASELNPSVKTALTAFLGATPLLTKLIANCSTGSTNDQLPEETFFQTVSPRFARR